MDYKSSGVDIDAGNKAVSLIKDKVKETYTPNVLGSLGSFAGAFNFPKEDYDNPILVSCTDGVGTKLRLAIEQEVFDTVGIDLVAMSVNDLICMGAKPLFFLDYVAVHALDPQQMEQIISGIVDGCKQSGCALIGGEMAEMNDMYKKGDFDLAGFCVGVVDRDKVIDGSRIAKGHYVYGLASSGPHSNGYSLLRKVLTKEVCEKEGLDRKSLLEPTKIYVKEVLELIKKHTVTGIAHITGGGLIENVERILPEGVSLDIDTSKVPKQAIFDTIARVGDISEDEMRRVFNMGVGLIVITPEPIKNPDYFHLGHIK